MSPVPVQRVPPAAVGTAPGPSPARGGRGRVLIADDSVVVRGLVGRWVEESGFEVVATAADGRAALDVIDRADPDIVLLDLDMPEIDGVTALPLILAKRPAVSVIVVSTLTRRNAALSLKCLSLGATDYLTKPETNREITTSSDFRAELIAKLHALDDQRLRRARDLARSVREAAAPGGPRRPCPAPARPRGPVRKPECLLIGASTGGPRAVAQVLAGLGPALAQVPTLIVQHMPPVFTAVFAENLSAQTGAAAREAENGEALAPGRIYVAPGGRHMRLARDRGRVVIRLDDGPRVNFCRPAVDVLFRDAAAAFGGAAVGLVLTGMGSDGALGARALVEAGASVLAQDEATSAVWGMPGSVARAGLAHGVLPLDEIAPALKEILGRTSA